MTSATGTKTILYYTGNRKHPEFEARVRDTLVKNNPGLPIVSVSQKPLNLGKNICVGDVGASYLNVYRQMFIGAQAVDTEYIVFAEDDFLYPPEYFMFEPDGHYFYRYENVWMVLWRGAYYKGYPIGGAQICRTDYAVNEMGKYLKGHPEWFDGNYKGFMGSKYWSEDFVMFTGPPIVFFKPQHNLSRSAAMKKESTRKLPLWGDVSILRRKYEAH